MTWGESQSIIPIEMIRRTTKRGPYLVIHGHFYQPPRENPWTERVERERTASPYHDWNKRISDQCYGPNSAARIVDGEGRILDIVNNYSSMSFNFGPTLLSWLERNDPITYERILEADRESVSLHSGHGNALAQVYNHLIMPLATYRDKLTQVKWGIEDFKYRFSREPEGMWLPETAVNKETLTVLAQNGIKFTILAPHQAKRVRKIGGQRWREVTPELLDNTKAYRHFLKEGHIDIFFYNGPLSFEIGFGDLLKNSQILTQGLVAALRPRKKRTQLILVANDGETFGHHKPFAEMALAYALTREAPEKGLTVTNLGSFIEENPSQWEVEIDEGARGEGSSWSCIHGVGRWKENCGCSTGGQPHWNQDWRKPLREGLDWLKGKLETIYEEEGKKYLRDVWKARDKYIEVILDRSGKNVNQFFRKIEINPLNEEEKIACLKLLEMQKNAMLMYTSCGWFFADISGLESVQILKYAARAIELAKDFTEEDLEGPLLKYLREAESNLNEFGDGEKIYGKLVKPVSVSPQIVMVNYALRLPFRKVRESRIKVGSYQIADKRGGSQRLNREKFSWGEGDIKNLITRENWSFLYLARFQKEEKLECWIKESTGNRWPKTPPPHPENFISQIEGKIGWNYFTLGNLPLEWKEEILGLLQREAWREVDRSVRTIYRKNLALMRTLREQGGVVPQIFNQLASFLLTQRIEEGIEDMREEFEENFKQVVQTHSEMRKIGYPPDNGRLESLLSDLLFERTKKLTELISLEGIRRMDMIFNLIAQWGLKPDLRRAQEIFYPLWIKLIGTKKKRSSQIACFYIPLRRLAGRFGFRV